MRTLDSNEVNAVSGGVGVPGGVVGGIVGGIVYGWNAAVSGQGSLGGFVGAVGGGAVLGAVGRPVSLVRAIWSVNTATAVGVTQAIASN
jgi:hypothetical protein